MEEACQNCYFWRPDGDGSGEGNCHRNPPMALGFKAGSLHAHGFWPMTCDSEWCGEWRQKFAEPSQDGRATDRGDGLRAAEKIRIAAGLGLTKPKPPV